MILHFTITTSLPKQSSASRVLGTSFQNSGAISEKPDMLCSGKAL